MSVINNVTVDARAAVARLDGAGGFMRTEITTRFRALGRTLRNELRAEVPVVTGRARRSIRARLARVRRQNDVTLLVDSNPRIAPHMKVLEHGATITPKSASKLAIPIGGAVTRRGAARFSARQVRDNPEAFGFSRTWVARDTVFGERQRGGRPVALFTLKSSVLITRRSFFKNKARQRRGLIHQTVRQAVRAGLKREVRVRG